MSPSRWKGESEKTTRVRRAGTVGDDGEKLDLSKDRRCRCRIPVPDDPEWMGWIGGGRHNGEPGEGK